jgi:hypothetical protein
MIKNIVQQTYVQELDKTVKLVWAFLKSPENVKRIDGKKKEPKKLS